ncbi:DNA-binding transcriptional response regulator, NtrC family, contains REC, AAA-type ATPase, and a Fis-type DNA-binding domains [Draconibacterium orientale]|jgi:DNA-binding NtrC family response regulator|uniref:Regulator n=1 Tax=Draconibacterium orientale TaxID=1168034 RepID=X5DCJ8_9BACT|nr:sigma-54 dependent transcriptional regulator [Draconibacterium orientale]AHW58684.1 regulator [Draconibacterium orientale]SET11530.1 DNA-binding transcriptional response regulator, NtrC family, contains REC, AAA-type ATPase, and a Fis-type DNA-binding domains [Draconibacterium orientale]
MANQKPRNNYKVYIVEDNVLYARVLKKQLLDDQLQVKVFHNGTDFINAMSEKPDVVTLDYTLPDMTGKEVLAKIQEKIPNTHVIVISAQDDISTAIELMKNGAYDYIMKAPDTREKLSNIIRNIYRTDQLQTENTNLKEAVAEKYNFKNLIKGNSREIEHVFELMNKATQTNISVSISGETGTGKELVAKGIHYNSKRSAKPFIAVNVSAIPDGLIESELFGHEKGAFTGADFQKIGKFEAANGGTLFLDEIADLNLNLQAKLLRVLQERELVRLGGHDVIPLDVRIISATHKNLATLSGDDQFRQDLYYRLLGLPIEIPPLRQRGNDKILLAKFFVDEFCRDNEMEPKTLSSEAKQMLSNYHYPGNIRELKAIMELACVMCSRDVIKPSHLNMNVDESVQNLLAQEKTLEEYNNEIVKFFLNKYNQNVRLVASKLGIGKSTIYRMLQKHMD